MKGNVFSKWLQEFCSLVFVQTIQAFVLAMIMTVVISALTTGSTNSNGSVADSEVLYSTGILAIIALSSISKIELLVKQIFGLGGGLGDKANMAEGKKGLLGSLVALQMARRSLDNVPKIISGHRQRARARSDIHQNRLRYSDRLNELNRDYNVNSDADIEAMDERTRREYNGRRRNIIETLQDQERTATQQVTDANRQILSGHFENIASIGGATTGFIGRSIFNAADGRFDMQESLNSAMGMMGAADAASQNMVRAAGTIRDMQDEHRQAQGRRERYNLHQTAILAQMARDNIDASNID